MRRELLAVLSVGAISLLTLKLSPPFLGAVEHVYGDLQIARHAQDHPWPDDLVTVPLTTEASEILAKGEGGILRREHVAVLWERLRQLGVRTILADDALTSPRDPDTDARAAAALARTYLPVVSGSDPEPPTPEEVALLLPHTIAVPPGNPIPGLSMKPPIEPFASGAAGLGQVLRRPDSDGRSRHHHPVVRMPSQPDRGLLSLPLRALLAQRGISLDAVRWTPSWLDVEGLPAIPLSRGGMLLELSPDAEPPPEIDVPSLFDPARESEARRAVEGRLAIIYTHRAGVDVKPSALGLETPGGLLIAHAVRTLSTGDTQRQVPLWQVFVPLVVLLAGIAPFALQYTPRSIAALTASAVALYAALQWQLLAFHVSLPAMVPMALIAGSGVVLSLQAMARMRDEILLARKRADAGLAPTGRIALVFTDVQGSTALWDAMPDAMREGLAVHNALMRATLAEAKGYEVKTEGDAFMIAFGDPLAAAAFCLVTQERLVSAEWPEALLAADDAREERDAAGARIHRGLRVRMGIHVGEPEPRVDPLTARMDYFGPHVNRAARVSGAAHGGQIVVSGDARAAIDAKRTVLPDHDVIDLGSHFLKGLLSAEHLYELRLASLRGRSFPPVKAGDRATGERPNVQGG